MNKGRIEGLTDAVFAIIMTLLVIEIRTPEVHLITETGLQHYLLEIAPVFTSYFLSFFVLVMFWMQHHAMFTFFTKELDRKMLLLNMIFLSILCLIPFSAHLLGSYPNLLTSVVFYGVNIILACILEIIMIKYALSSLEIRTEDVSSRDIKQAKIRLYITPVLTFLGIILSFFGASFAPIFFLFPILFNIVPGGLNRLEKIFRFKIK